MDRDQLHRRLTLLEVSLDEEELAAVEGWRQANMLTSQEDAVRALLKLALISEVARTYRSLFRDPAASENGHDPS